MKMCIRLIIVKLLKLEPYLCASLSRCCRQFHQAVNVIKRKALLPWTNSVDNRVVISL